MRKFTKLMSLALAAVLTLSLLAGCGGKGGVGGNSAGLEVEFRLLHRSGGMYLKYRFT